ncbi:hypothetical protein [Tissierella praeacuta]|uniref:hypothetical protein n=1 Tax=Tissierella praeacuta TaxID=43131 RepID=UPI0028A6F853|nr:hypothetical protein [Tissierella praeacuta]
MAIRVIKHKIKVGDIEYGIGEVIEGLSKEEEDRLVVEGYAEGVKVIVQKSVEGNGEETDIKLQLDENFNATELKEAAQAVGLEFPGNISKANLIEQIIELKKAEEVLNVEFEEYEVNEE